MKALRDLALPFVFWWMYLRLTWENINRQMKSHVYRAVPRYPMKLGAVTTNKPSRKKVHPLDDSRLARQRAEWN